MENYSEKLADEMVKTIINQKGAFGDRFTYLVNLAGAYQAMRILEDGENTHRVSEDKDKAALIMADAIVAQKIDGMSRDDFILRTAKSYLDIKVNHTKKRSITPADEGFAAVKFEAFCDSRYRRCGDSKSWEFDYRGFTISLRQIPSPYGILWEASNIDTEPQFEEIAYSKITEAEEFGKNQIDKYMESKK